MLGAMGPLPFVPGCYFVEVAIEERLLKVLMTKPGAIHCG